MPEPLAFISSHCLLSLDLPLPPDLPSIAAFLSTTNPAPSCFVSLDIVPDKDDESPAPAITASSAPPPSHNGCLIFINSLYPTPITSHKQINTLTLGPSSSSSETLTPLHILSKHALLPLTTFTDSSAAGVNPDKATAATNNLTKKLTEFNMVLAQAANTTLIPDLSLTPHPTILTLLDQEGCLTQPSSPHTPSNLALPLPPPSLLVDDDFLNALQLNVNVWIKEIAQITALITTTPFPPTITEEITFWSSLSTTLSTTQTLLDTSPATLLTISILTAAKRFMSTMALQNNTNLAMAIEHSQDCTNFLTQLPLSPLLSATTIPTLTTSLSDCFTYLPKVRNSKYYNLTRVAQLFESLTLTLSTTLADILTNAKLLTLPYEDFAGVERHVKTLTDTFDADYKKFTSFYLEQSKRRAPTKDEPATSTPLQTLKSLTFHHRALLDRFSQLVDFRAEHNSLLAVTTSISTQLDDQSKKQLDASYHAFTATISQVSGSPLDTSSEASRVFQSALGAYQLAVDDIETSLTALLHSRLAATTSTPELFKIFSLFNPLFVRPKIRGAIKQYQQTLITSVNTSITNLQEQFLQSFATDSRSSASPNHVVSSLLPPTAAKILHAQLLQNELTRIMGRMSAVLGAGWEQQMEGRALRKICDVLTAKLDTKTFFKMWRKNMEKELANVLSNSRQESYLIQISTQPVSKTANNSCPYIPTCNLSATHLTLFKETRNLKWMGFDIPPLITKVAEESLRKYPSSQKLKSALLTYTQIRAAISHDPSLPLLILPSLSAIHDAIKEAFNPAPGSPGTTRRVRWDSKNLDEYVASIAELTFTLDEKTTLLLSSIKLIDEQILAIPTVPFTPGALSDVLANIQSHVDSLSLASFVNLDIFTDSLNETIATHLSTLLTAALADISLSPIKVEITLANQIIQPTPSLPEIKTLYFAAVNAFLDTVASLPLVTPSRFDAFKETATGTDASDSAAHNANTFSHILQSPEVAATLTSTYETIFDHLTSTQSHIAQWLQYQSLWDVPLDTISATLSTDIAKWTQLLTETSTARAALDSPATTTFGPVEISTAKVINKIDLKYDAWQKSLQALFATILAKVVTDTIETLGSSKTILESIHLQGATPDVIKAITFIQASRQKLKSLTLLVAQLDSSEAMLKTQRFSFPATWTSTALLTSLFADFNTILSRRGKQMDDQIPALQQRVRAEDKQTTKRVADLLASWESQKPLDGATVPAAALDTLASFEIILNAAMASYADLSSAKLALSLPPSPANPLQPIHEELTELSEVWTTLSPTHTQLEQINEQLFAAVIPRKIRKSLEALLEDLRTLPSRIRQYDIYTHIYNQIKSYITNNSLLADLKTEALKPRHWATILTRLALHLPFVDLTLGHLYDANLIGSKKAVAEVLSVAQGEMALEEFLRQVRDYWSNCTLELVLYQNRVRLIKGWDLLFAKLEEHLSSLSQMKLSPYFKSVTEFQEETAAWENRLTLLREILDSWLDVQRRWVYLESIFFGSADIKAQLPSEYSRFKSVDTEFVAIMRKIAAKPNVLEALTFENLLPQLSRLLAMMNKIQKALGEYLANQREAFSRFYFVGDEDLLEIIGNSASPIKVFPHLSKMFAAISNMLFTGDNTASEPLVLTHMCSKDGESVALATPIPIPAKAPVREWFRSIESGMQQTLASLLNTAYTADQSNYISWASLYPAQIMILASQISWSMECDSLLATEKAGALKPLLEALEAKLTLMATTVLSPLEPSLRKKYEQLITELVHQRDVTRSLIHSNVVSAGNFKWLYHLRFTFTPDQPKLLQQLNIRIANASFFYGFEYLGIGERLVQTPLTDRCYLTLTQALHFRMGGNPFGPAGTGKTESVKALGAQLGRFVLVFNCDEAFDFSAMGRLFAGLCQVGAWGCFDEFNRLEERILSAVSEQILTIQRGLQSDLPSIEILNRPVALHSNVGIFVTMNPGYAGRSNLPDNLKQLFRAVAMTAPNKALIAQVMLYSQGIVSAEELSGKVVLLFQLCEEQLSSQSHYDFGLRALKTLLVSAGGLKRGALADSAETSSDSLAAIEQQVLIQGACNNVVPKLVAEDIPLFSSLLKAVFPAAELSRLDDETLSNSLKRVCTAQSLVQGQEWFEKILQLKEVLSFRHGVMLVGPSGSGKSTAWRSLLSAMEMVDGVKGDSYVIDPKAIDKEALYGSLDPTTMEWTDGIFTATLRTIIANQRGESKRHHWILFDGDVDPEWAENLNSVLDDNKLLTLPSGERLSIPDNVRILMEVDSLKEATPATVSRCGMIWFSEDTVTSDMCLKHMMKRFGDKFDDDDEGRFTGLTPKKSKPDGPSGGEEKKDEGAADDDLPPAQQAFLASVRPYFVPEATQQSLISDMLELALTLTHVMTPTRGRLLNTLECLLQKGINQAVEYDENHIDFPMAGEHMANYSKKWMLHSLVWAFAGSCGWSERERFGEALIQAVGMTLPDSSATLADYKVREADGEWESWSDSVPKMEIESHKVTASDVVITTTDTVRHIDVLGAWLSTRRPLILCGPPGSGKTMTLTSTLQSLPDVVLAPLNFSSGTTPELILKTFHQHCDYVRTPKGVVLQPNQSIGVGKWLVIFCDEINLPEKDAYGTQKVISFMRQLIEQGGFWRDDCVWVSLARIQFVGACNPPTDAGRVVLSSRFLRHSPLLLVDFPARDSLMQIYRTFNGGVLKLFPNLKGEVDSLTEAMVELYLENQKRFTVDVQPQYFYSPRELSRWVRAIYEAVRELDGMSRGELVRLWAHEAMRLFCDRLVTEEEREWCGSKIDEVANKCWGGLEDWVLQRPILYSTWLSKQYSGVTIEGLRGFMSARLKVFYEEELDVPLVVFDEVLLHVLRIDRVLKQPMGHCLLVGDSGAGKTVLSKFVSWMNGLSIFQIKAHSKYGLEDFNEDLRDVMRRVGVGGEKICFIFDESNALSGGFLEAMNALLASGEVPGLFEGDDLNALMNLCREGSLKEGGGVDEDELWQKFTNTVQRNLHVVFTMNPSGDDFSNRSTTSPALFNRCVVDWMGTWGVTALGQVAKEFIATVDMGVGEGEWSGAVGKEGARLLGNVESVFIEEGEEEEEGVSMRQAVVAALVNIHNQVKDVCATHNKTALTKNYVSPRDYLDLINNFVKVVREKRGNLEDQQRHIGAGLEKLKSTQEQVRVMEEGLGAKKAELTAKEAMANSKLQQMIEDQNEAEVQKKEALKINEEVAKQQGEIEVRQKEAEEELGEAEPALQAAMQSVRSIKKRDLDEIRALARPPDNVRMTLEAIAIMLGEKKLEWPDIRKMLQNKEFIPSILEFDVDNLTDRQIQVVKENYTDSGVLSVEAVTKSSKACGPLYKWAASQIGYSVIFNKVQPLREEVERLQEDAKEAVEKKEAVEEEVRELEERIVGLKGDYAELIRGVEMIKSEMGGVKTKVERAESLLKSLMSESERWEESSGGFEVGLACVIGDALVSAGFLSYSGFFDHKLRGDLVRGWKETLDSCGVKCRDDYEESIEYLSKAGERLEWEGMGLGGDKLSMENAIILERCDRFPFVIDPRGVCSSFLVKKYESTGGKVSKTSFLDGGFMKTLASAIRFGTMLLVEDVEGLDPILNPVLNKELVRTGGRTMVRLGAEEVDFSPKFKLVLTTRNGGVKLTPDLCSRVSLVNFTVTPASLQSQALGLLLKTEKPELEEKRGLLLKVRGEQNVKLRELEEQLLEKISSAEGSILDDDELIKGMEVVKAEAGVVGDAMMEGEKTMGELAAAIGEFEGLSLLVSELYFVLEGLKGISSGFYQYSLGAYLEIVGIVVREESGVGKGGKKRLEELKGRLVREVVGRAARGLFEEDKLVLGLKLCQLVSGKEFVGGGVSEELVGEGAEYIGSVFGKDFEWQGRGLNELGVVVRDEVRSGTPILLCSAPGYDVSGRVRALADEEGIAMKSIAMGSSEGYGAAESLIGSCIRDGSWCMLKNIHLCNEDWLQGLEKKLYGMDFGGGAGGGEEGGKFRLFLTSEVGEMVRDGLGGFKIPMTLLSMSDVFVCEAPTGLKNNVLRFFMSIDEKRFEKKPVERGRLYLLVSWLYAVVLERLRFSPTGWSRRYEFSEGDAINAVDVADAWVDRAGGGSKKAHIAPEDLPWEALRTILSESVFGGRLDNEYDQAILDSFVRRLFCPEAFDVSFEISEGLVIVEGGGRKDMLAWIEGLPESNSCTWLGLSSAAEKSRLRLGGERIVGKLMGVRGGREGRGRGSSMSEKNDEVRGVCERWIAIVEEALGEAGEDSGRGGEDSLGRCYEREKRMGAGLAERVRADLASVVTYCKGECKLSSCVKDLYDCIQVGGVPRGWLEMYESACVLGEKWIDDFCRRISQSKRLGGSGGGKVWVGGLFNPVAWVTASRQHVAEELKCGIDELGLGVEVGEEGGGEGGGGKGGFAVEGMCMEGAKLVNGGGLECSDEVSEELGGCVLRWSKGGGGGEGGGEGVTRLPIYLNGGSRKNIVVSVGVAAGGGGEKGEEMRLRGVAFFLS